MMPASLCVAAQCPETVGLETEKSSERLVMVYSPLACIRQSSLFAGLPFILPSGTASA